MERGFGRDLSGVRVHTDERTARATSQVSSIAFTVGKDIVFGPGRYAPQTPVGRTLLAHELTHVVQQEMTGATEVGGAGMASAGTDSAELEAARVSSMLAQGQRAPAIAAPGRGLQRAEEDELAPNPYQSGQPAPGSAPAKTGSPSGPAPTKTGPTSGTPPAKTGPTPTKEKKKEEPKAGEKKDEDKSAAELGITFKVVAHGASEAAQKAAKEHLDAIFGRLRGPSRARLKGKTVEMHIIPVDQKLTDLPEFAKLKGQKTFDGRMWDDVRGIAGGHSGDTLRYAVGEEDLAARTNTAGAVVGGILGGILGGGLLALAGVGLGKLAAGKGGGAGAMIAGGIIGGVLGAVGGAIGGAMIGKGVGQKKPRYGPGFLPGHEGAHIVGDFALTPDQSKALKKSFDDRKTAGGPWLPPEDYTSANQDEYFANSAAAFSRRPYSARHKERYTPEWLKSNDQPMYDLLESVFGKP
jgi:Domain of unknown function (DUF4157)